MTELPESEYSLVLRTDFSDDPSWTRLCREIEAPVGPFRAYVSFLSDPDFAGLSIGALTALGQRGRFRSFLFVVDGESLRNPEHPILVLDLVDQPGRTFRVVPREMWGVENNLSISNMDFSDFADKAGPTMSFAGLTAIDSGAERRRDASKTAAGTSGPHRPSRRGAPPKTPAFIRAFWTQH